jgi:hypothetical protein
MSKFLEISKPCSKCGDPIVWAKTRRGTWLPLEAYSVSDLDVKTVTVYKDPILYRHGRHKVHLSLCQSNVHKLKKELKRGKQRLRRERKSVV